MVTYPIDHYRKSPMTNGNHKEFPPRVNDIDTFPAIQLLYLLVTFFIIGVSWREYHKNDQPRKEDDQLRKENDQLRIENGKLQNEIDERKAQFKNGWQKTSLYPDWRKEFFQAVDITLDPATAHPSLFLSEGNRRVTWEEKSQDLPEDPQRFYSLPCVLGHQVITTGRWYWEVEVGTHGAWDLGICRPHVMRKGRVCIKPEDGFWALRFYKQEYWALTSPETKLTVKVHPARVCIFLEYEEGSISFYNMVDKSHIHTLSQGAFGGPLKPFFRLWPSESEPLTICPGPEAAQNPLY
ncbi:butyrophilin subfamily 1 member A1 isoform X2 [Bos taurus]|uniref:butyrophilin subfamily 1 member A1 isoform X2 n=1 Tax=Bos taurus TaxID=9913 RepID=UPI000D537A56|nr:butyrophilin subfamily 1 member A1 isoform X2 [Bos taurus]